MKNRRAETDEHKMLKALMFEKLTSWLTGSTKKEYLSSGHELDVFYVSYQGISIMVEIIWTPTIGNFQRDLILLLDSNAKVKIVIANPQILQNDKLVLLFEKSRISELQKGCLVSPMLDGKKILDVDSKYVDTYVRELVLSLIDHLSTDPQAVQFHFAELKASVIYPLLKGLGSECIPSLDKIEEVLGIHIDLFEDFFDHYESIREKYKEVVKLQDRLNSLYSEICTHIDSIIISRLDSYKINHAPNYNECNSSACIPIDKFRERTINCVINNFDINEEIISDSQHFNIMFRSETASNIFRIPNDADQTLILQQLRDTARSVIENMEIVKNINRHGDQKRNYLLVRKTLQRSLNTISHKTALSRPNCIFLEVEEECERER